MDRIALSLSHTLTFSADIQGCTYPCDNLLGRNTVGTINRYRYRGIIEGGKTVSNKRVQ